jgi:DNA polymerase I-like protein with 3'-5' exonuclease and polymerase domains
LYSRAKQGVFAMLYGGEEYTLANRVGISEEASEVAYREFSKDFPQLAANRQAVASQFEAISQPGGIGTRVEWNEPADYVESIFGFRRYFTLENQILKALYELAQDPPDEWSKIKLKVIRRDREQTVRGAVSSALYGASFAIQGAVMRAAGNHVIQSPGATITKRLQCRLWEFQPVGIHPWMVMPSNFHDELMVPLVPRLSDAVAEAVEEFIEEYSEYVPLIGMDWSKKLIDWSGK